MTTYRLAKSIIDRENYEYNDMMKKLDTFLLGERITVDQYTELTGMMEAQRVVAE